MIALTNKTGRGAFNQYMKQQFYALFSLFMLCLLATTTQAQSIYPVKYQSQADVKVYVVKYESQCDLKVYMVNYESQASGNDGNWFTVKYESQADKTVFFVDYESQADLKIFYVDYQSQAGWRNTSKKHLMY